MKAKRMWKLYYIDPENFTECLVSGQVSVFNAVGLVRVRA